MVVVVYYQRDQVIVGGMYGIVISNIILPLYMIYCLSLYMILT